MNFVLLQLFLLGIVALSRGETYKFTNNCPNDLALYHGAQVQQILSPQKSFFAGLNTEKQPYYTNLNGGKVGGEGALQFGVLAKDTSPQHTYYFFKKQGHRLNVGLSVKPSVKPTSPNPPADGLCSAISCTADDCADSFSTSSPVPSSLEPPTPPLHSCSGESVDYQVTFCPNGKLPNPIAAREIHPKDDKTRCLSVRDGILEGGSTLVVDDCDSKQSQKWNIDHGKTQIRIAGTDLCLDRDDLSCKSGRPCGRQNVEAELGGFRKTPEIGGSDRKKVDFELRLAKCRSGWQPQHWDYTESGQNKHGASDRCIDTEDGVKFQKCKSKGEGESQAFDIESDL